MEKKLYKALVEIRSSNGLLAHRDYYTHAVDEKKAKENIERQARRGAYNLRKRGEIRFYGPDLRLVIKGLTEIIEEERK